MAKSLNDLLGFHTLTGLIQATVPGVPDVLPPAFDSFKKDVLMDDGEYTVRYGNRGVAKKGRFGAAAIKRGLRDIGVQPVKLMHFIEEIEFDAKTMMKLRSVNSYEHDSAYEEFTSQVAYFNEYFTNLRKTLKMMALRSGTLYFDEEGNLLPSSSGATETITIYTQNASHINQLDVFGDGNLITAAWTSASTDIPGQIRSIKQASRADTGYPIKHAIYGKNVPSYMTSNTYVRDYLARDGGGRSEWVKDNEIGHLFGLDWSPGYEQFWRSGATQSTVNYVLGDNEILFTPEPSKDWWERLDGSYPVPTNINIVTDAEAAMDQIKLVNGKFSYAQVMTRPIGALLTCGDTFLYVNKVPDAVYRADVG
jgi:hypothetical protein